MRGTTAELRFLLHEARERCPSTDVDDVMTMHVEQVIASCCNNPRLVILNPGGAINRQGVDRKDRLGSRKQLYAGFNG